MDNCPYYVLDTSRTSNIPDFIAKVMKEHLDFVCLVNNAGVQRPLDVNTMDVEEFVKKADNEVSTNITRPLHLAVGLLPHFRGQSSAVVMNVSSVLGYIPTLVMNPVSFFSHELLYERRLRAYQEAPYIAAILFEKSESLQPVFNLVGRTSTWSLDPFFIATA